MVTHRSSPESVNTVITLSDAFIPLKAPMKSCYHSFYSCSQFAKSLMKPRSDFCVYLALHQGIPSSDAGVPSPQLSARRAALQGCLLRGGPPVASVGGCGAGPLRGELVSYRPISFLGRAGPLRASAEEAPACRSTRKASFPRAVVSFQRTLVLHFHFSDLCFLADYFLASLVRKFSWEFLMSCHSQVFNPLELEDGQPSGLIY